MKVKKHNGNLEEIKFDKIKNKLDRLCSDLNLDYIDTGMVTTRTISRIYDGISTEELDNLSASICASQSQIHYDYALLGGRILISRLHKKTLNTFSEYINDIKDINLLDSKIVDIINKHSIEINSLIDLNKDFSYDFFAIKTLMKSYLIRKSNNLVERPQYLIMRVALELNINRQTYTLDLKGLKDTYKLLSDKAYTHATPTLFNSCLKTNQLASCFLVSMENDSLEGIFNTLKNCALISKYGAGIGLDITPIRGKGSYIKSTNGYSNGIIPMLRVFNETARYVDQGGGKRKGSIAIYLEPWHSEILSFLDLRKNHGVEELRARDLFLSLWIPDLFMERVEKDEDWTLFSPNDVSDLNELYGDNFKKKYEFYESSIINKEVVKARAIWKAILTSQVETGTPYLLYKDASNLKSNQKNLGTIKCSNLCAEIIQYSSSTETAVCNLASISLPYFYDKYTKSFNFDKLLNTIKLIVVNLNHAIDNSFYPVQIAKDSNLKHRPMGIGIQGLADLFYLLGINFDSKEALDLNYKISETMYYGALLSSMELSKKHGPYSTFKGSPASKGILQFDMWGIKPSRYSWNQLKADIIKYGLRNSLLISHMPTASTSQILGNNECFEPYTTNIYIRRTLSGEFVCVNKHLIKDLIKLNLWDKKGNLKNEIIKHYGSIQYITSIPQKIKDKYKTVWELSQKSLIDLAVGRGAFTCQSQSLNLFLVDTAHSKLSSMHFYAWKKGLKTGIYYLRSKPKVQAQQFTVTDKNTNSTISQLNDCEICNS